MGLGSWCNEDKTILSNREVGVILAPGPNNVNRLKPAWSTFDDFPSTLLDRQRNVNVYVTIKPSSIATLGIPRRTSP
jgi:hypothetical protein